ncbi:MAG: O-antigen ligase family protein [Aggregatilineales bacterium]
MRATLQRKSTWWTLLGGALGIGAGTLPLTVTLLGVGTIGALLIGLAQPGALFVITLVIAPLKALLDTEVPGLPGIGQVAFVITIAVWLAARIAARKPLMLWSPAYWPIAMILMASSLSLFVALSPADTLSELIKWAEIVIVAALAGTLCVENGWIWPVIGLVATAGTQALIGLYQFFGGSGAPNLWILDNHYFRAFGTFGQPNPFGACLGLALPVALGLLWGQALTSGPSPTGGRGKLAAGARNPLLQRWKGGWGVRAILLLVALLLVAGLIASWSRGAWLGAAAAIAVMIVFAPRRRWIGVTIAVSALVISGLALASGIIPASLAARLGDFTSDLSGFQDVRGQVITDANYAVLERLAHWQAGLAMADANPWLGVGFGNYELAYPGYRLMNWPIPLGHAHNYFINMLAETGIIGASVYILAWIAIIWLTIRVLNRTTGVERGLALGLLGSWTYLSVHSLFDKLYVNNLHLHVGTLIGILGGLIYLAQRRDVGRGTNDGRNRGNSTIGRFTGTKNGAGTDPAS